MAVLTPTIRAQVAKYQLEDLPLSFLYQTKTLLRPYATRAHATTVSQDRQVRSQKTVDSGHRSSANYDEPTQKVSRRAVGKPIARTRALRSANHGTPNVPFESGVPFENDLTKLEGTTMTPKELFRFQALLKKPQNDRSHNTKAPREKKDRPAFPEPLRALAAEAEKVRNESREMDGVTDVPITDVPDKYLVQVKDRMDQASTDVDLWNIVHTDVLNRVTNLQEELNKPQHIADAKKRQIFTKNLPQLLLYFMRVIQTSFPGSPLGVVLLPTIKKLGSSAFALAVTTETYNQHMRLLYKKYSDLDGVAETLSEMDKEVYEFNGETKELLASIMNHAHASIKGRNGRGQQALWLTDRKTRALAKLERWRKVVDERVNMAALRKARERSTDPMIE